MSWHWRGGGAVRLSRRPRVYVPSLEQSRGGRALPPYDGGSHRLSAKIKIIINILS